MQTFTSEYRAWMIQEINSTLSHPLVDTDLMTTPYIEELYDTIVGTRYNGINWKL